ncbi:hypothetical protein CVT26_002610 [Gymnopilus dilepis]|uniref:Hydrophobin n=1 Tax=Gymnopilus dilepis TaxID=231916 RepID=A0A409VF64_9AGAR|nr:hypothetical protein CVT26_002610 [Gymnopilus dilepis]
MSNTIRHIATSLLILLTAQTVIAAGPLGDIQSREAVSQFFPFSCDIYTEIEAQQLSPNAQVCTGGAGVGCVTIPISSDTCINFTGGLSFLNKEASTAVIPAGFVCTFYEQSGCLSAQGGADVVVLQGGSWNLASAPGTASATVNFNDRPSSFNCSPV